MFLSVQSPVVVVVVVVAGCCGYNLVVGSDFPYVCMDVYVCHTPLQAAVFNRFSQKFDTRCISILSRGTFFVFSKK